MAFLDNSGDIILDAVLTDTGRMRLAKGDGSFRIVKFALSDDEIDYSTFNKTHASGSAYFDLEILQTPILEAFTNNGSSMKSRLLSIPRTNLLYLPVIRLNLGRDGSKPNATRNAHLVAVDTETENTLTAVSGILGILKGANPGEGGSTIRCDQGLDTTEIPPSRRLDSDLVETQYIVEIDNRLGSIASPDGARANVSFIDDDQIASYYFSLGTDAGFVTSNTNAASTLVNGVDTGDSTEAIAGPRGTILQFRLQSSIELNTTDYLFDKLGSTDATNDLVASTTFKYIDTLVRVSGATTGFKLDIPVRFMKKTS